MPPVIRRRVAGITALLLLSTSAVLLLGTGSNDAHAIGAMFFRAGLVLGATWLAFPQMLALTAHIPPRLAFGLVAAAFVLIVRPAAFRYVAAAVLILAVVEFAGWLKNALSGRPQENRERHEQGPTH
jgi:Ca2+/Na+ antiporter